MKTPVPKPPAKAGNPQVAQRAIERLAPGRFADSRFVAAQRKKLDAAFKPALQRQPAKGALPANLKSGIESLSGAKMDDVRVHYNSAQPAAVGALAYTQGRDIHVAPGQEQHLPHEAWHVVQQAQGIVRPTMQLQRGIPINDDRGLEREADVMGARALQRASAPEKKKRP